MHRIWNDATVAAQVGRMALAPLETVYRGVIAIRGELFDRGLVESAPSPVGVVSVGNITVGGTGKTPVSAWVAERLVSLGRKPAIVLRGYGGDEPLVHSRLNPGVPVVVDPDRVRGIRKAADDGAESVVLDDGFQHRRAARNLDFVLVSADDWSPSVRLLPAGPYRESPESLRRASAVLITAKAVSPEAVEKVGEWIAHVAPGKPVAVLSLVQYDLVRADLSGETRPVSALAGKRIVAVAALGNPSAFFRQLEAAGATVIPIRFADHHPFTTEDAARAARLSRGADFVVCTLKDAVKLAPLWPATASPLWYVSLSVEVDRGGAALDEMLRRLPGRRG